MNYLRVGVCSEDGLEAVFSSFSGLDFVRFHSLEELCISEACTSLHILLFDAHTVNLSTHLSRIRNKSSQILLLAVLDTREEELIDSLYRIGVYDILFPPLSSSEAHASIRRTIEMAKQIRDNRLAINSYTILTSNVKDTIYSLSPDGMLIDVIGAGEKVFGYDPTELIGKPIKNLVDPKDLDRFARSFEELYTKKVEGVQTATFRIVTKEGESRCLEMSRQQVFDTEGLLVQIEGVARDITDQRHMEYRLKAYSEELESRVAERTEKLETANTQLAALTEISSFLTQIIDESTLLDEVPKLLTKALGFDRAALLLEKDDLLVPVSWSARDDREKLEEALLAVCNDPNFVFPEPFSKALEDGKTIYVKDFEAPDDWPEILQKRLSFILSPIIVKGKKIGLIEGDLFHQQRQMDEQDKARFEMFANMIGMAIENIRVYETLEQRVIEKTKSLRHANRELEASKRKLEAILNSSNSALLLVDQDGIVTASNRIPADLPGLDQNRLQGAHIDVVLNSMESFFHDKDLYRDLCQSLRENPLPHMDPANEKDLKDIMHRAVRTNENPARFIAINSHKIVDHFGDDLHSIWSFSDITPFRRFDEQIRAIVNNSPIPSIIFSSETKSILFANSFIGELVGIESTLLIGKSIDGYMENREDFNRLIDEMKLKKIISGRELLVRHPIGKLRWVLVSLVPAELTSGPVIIATFTDIHERKKAEEQLRLYRNIFLNAKDPIAVLDNNGRFIEINPALSHLSGYKPEELVGSTTELIFGDKGYPNLKSSYVSDSDSMGFSEFEALTKSGKSIDIDLSWFKINDEDGNPVYGVGIARDITERKQAEKQLAIRLHYEEALAACSQTLLTENKETNPVIESLEILLEASNGSRAYLIQPDSEESQEILAHITHQFCRKGVAPFTRRRSRFKIESDGSKMPSWIRALSTGDFVGGLVEDLPTDLQMFYRKTGTLSVLILPLISHSQHSGVLVIDDVTKPRIWNKVDIRAMQTAAEMFGAYFVRKRVENDLRVSEERFRTIVENANDIIFQMTLEGEINYVSPKFNLIKVGSDHEMLGKSFTDFIGEDQVDTTRELLNNLQETGEDLTGYEFKHLTSCGKVIWFTLNLSVVHTDKGDPHSFIGILRDITSLKQHTEELASAYKDLQQTQSQLVQSEKMASLGMLVAGIAHEINTPVGAISSMHNTLLRAFEKLKAKINEADNCLQDDKKVELALKVIEDANRIIENGTQRVTTIVRRLRSFARLDEAELKTSDIEDGIDDTLMLLHHELKHGITIEKDYGGLRYVACYPGRLNQVFLNILNNARQAMNGKGTIKIRTWIENKQVHVSFTDSGDGIPPENLEKIFDPGFTTKGVGVGTGLGLSICYQIMQDHMGTIRVSSEPGDGATFTVVFPENLDELLENT